MRERREDHQQRRDQADPGMTAQMLVDGVADVWVEVYRIDDMDVAIVFGQLAQGSADRDHAGTEVLAAVRRDENDASIEWDR